MVNEVLTLNIYSSGGYTKVAEVYLTCVIKSVNVINNKAMNGT